MILFYIPVVSIQCTIQGQEKSFQEHPSALSSFLSSSLLSKVMIQYY